MGIRDLFRRGGNDEKAVQAQFQQGSVVEGTQAVNRLINTLTAVGTPAAFPYRQLARDPRDLNSFGPANPLSPSPLDPPGPNGRVVPRYTEYEPAENLNLSPMRTIPFQTLRDASDGIDLVRRCIEKRKKEIAAREWSFSIAPWAVNLEAAKSPGTPTQDIVAKLTKEYAADIAKANQFWRFPGRNQDYDWKAWVFAALEEYLVLDAWVVYPQKTYGGDLVSLDLIDGTTIKPLRDWRGGRPQAPYPAFQQILYGLPRGEMQVSFELLEDGQTKLAKNVYMADQLYYIRRCNRIKSLYGFSAVEQALISARLYLKRQGWMLSEYDDGTIPMAWIEAAAQSGELEMDVRQRRIWEDAMNDEMSGNTAERHRLKMLPPGFKAVETNSVDERYKPDYDLFLIKLLAMHFDIPASELGFSEAKGLGSAGFHEGQADSYERSATLPDTRWFSEQVSRIAHEQLGIRPEVVHKFTGIDEEDEAAQDAVWENRIRTGRATINEDRARLNLPLYTFKEANMPIFASTRGIVFLAGASDLAPPGVEVTPPEFQPGTQGQKETAQQETGAQGPSGASKSSPAGKNPSKTAKKPASSSQKALELAQWRKFVKNGSNRPFEFKFCTPDDLPDLVDDPMVVWSD